MALVYRDFLFVPVCTAVFSGKSFSPASTWFDKFFSKSAKNMICLLITHQFCNTFFAAFPSNTFLTNYKNSFSPLEKKPSLARRFCTFWIENHFKTLERLKAFRKCIHRVPKLWNISELSLLKNEWYVQQSKIAKFINWNIAGLALIWI